MEIGDKITLFGNFRLNSLEVNGELDTVIRDYDATEMKINGEITSIKRENYTMITVKSELGFFINIELIK